MVCTPRDTGESRLPTDANTLAFDRQKSRWTRGGLAVLPRPTWTKVYLAACSARTSAPIIPERFPSLGGITYMFMFSVNSFARTYSFSKLQIVGWFRPLRRTLSHQLQSRQTLLSYLARNVPDQGLRSEILDQSRCSERLARSMRAAICVPAHRGPIGQVSLRLRRLFGRSRECLSPASERYARRRT